MTDDTQPEAREFTMSQYASKDDMIGAMRKRIAELESELEAVGAGGVQALSAAPVGWKAVPVNPTPEMWKAAKSVPDPNPPYPPHYGLVWDAMLAASPTPPAEQTFITPETGNSASAKGAAITSESGTPTAEQQAQPGAVYAELPAPTASIGTDDAWHEAAMRDFADRTHAARLRCKSEQARLATLWGYVRADAAPKAAPGEPPGIQALMCVISSLHSLRDTEHFSDEEGELTNDLCTLRDWAYAQTAAFQPAPTAQAADSVTAPATPPECETEAEKRAFAFGWFKALESERMKAESVQEDAARLDWLEQNLFHREKDEWDTKFGGYKEYNMWVLFSPKGIQGSARNIIDAAREQGADHDR